MYVTKSHAGVGSIIPESIRDPRWVKGPRSRVEKIRVGKKFIAIDGHTFKVTRHADNLTYVEDKDGKSTFFANCAEGVVVS